MLTNVVNPKINYGNSELHQKLAVIIHSILPADKIFLLGGSMHQETSESIFYASPSVQNHYYNYFLVVLCNDLQHKPAHEWQDKIECHCQKQVPVTILLSQTARFKEWLANGHLFAKRVVNEAPVIMDNSQETFMVPAKDENLLYQKKIEEAIRHSIKNVEEFLSGADLYIERKQSFMAAFMLHQATEQALTTILKKGTGYHTHTHNLERLIQLCSLVTRQVSVIFPGKTEREKQEFGLLQKAYSESRYRPEYSIGLNEILHVQEKVMLLRNLALDLLQEDLVPKEKKVNTLGSQLSDLCGS